MSQQRAHGGQAPDVLRHPVSTAVVLVWHGRGPNEGYVLRRLAAALHGEGHTVITPNWDASAADGGAAVLQASLAQAAAVAAERPSVPLVLVGWSLGGTAALSLALRPSMTPRPTAVIGLAADPRAHSPVDDSVPVERAGRGVDVPPLILIHGVHDTVVPAVAAEEFASVCHAAGVACTLTLVDSDHAGVVGTKYDPAAQICVPSEAPAATNGLNAALQAVRAAVTQH